MSNQGKQITDLSSKGSIADTSDKLVFVYNAANSELAQTALISVQNLLANSADLKVVAANLVVKDHRADPANSAALTLPQGTLFFSNNYGYYAIANNTLVRWAVSTF